MSYEDLLSKIYEELPQLRGQLHSPHVVYLRPQGKVYITFQSNVLVEEASRRDENQMAGKNEYNITVNFPGDKSLVGQIVKVKITSAGESTLRGERVD